MLTTRIFNDYGQGSLRAEAELSKMLMLEVLYNGELPRDKRALGFYQYGTKKFFITMNEYLRDTEENPPCIAAGHDRHVMRIASFFNPYMNTFDKTFVKILCRVCSDSILWNFNEFVGQMEQCLKSKRGSQQERFAIQVMRDMIMEYPEYKSLVMYLVKDRQWQEIMTAKREE